MTKSRKYGFSLVELLVVVAVVAITLTLGFSFYKNNYVKAKISNAFNAFEPIKIALTEFRSLQGDLRKVNTAKVQDTWVKLNIKDPLTATSNLASIRVWSMDQNKVQVLICLHAQDLGLPLGSKFGLLYDGVYNGNQLNWQCGFLANNTNASMAEDLKLLLPESCRKVMVAEMLECK